MKKIVSISLITASSLLLIACSQSNNKDTEVLTTTTTNSQTMASTSHLKTTTVNETTSSSQASETATVSTESTTADTSEISSIDTSLATAAAGSWKGTELDQDLTVSADKLNLANPTGSIQEFTMDLSNAQINDGALTVPLKATDGMDAYATFSADGSRITIGYSSDAELHFERSN